MFSWRHSQWRKHGSGEYTCPTSSGVAGPLAAQCGGQICRSFVLGFGNRQARREVGEKRESFPGPHNVWGPPSFKNTEKVFQIATFWPPQICIKSIFSRDSAPDPAGPLGDRAYDAPLTPNQVVRGQWYPVSSLSTLDVDVQSEFSRDFFLNFARLPPLASAARCGPHPRTPLATPLPASVIDTDSLAVFKSKLKTHLFTVAYWL